MANKTEEFVLNYEVNVVDIKYIASVKRYMWSLIKSKICEKGSKYIKRKHTA